MVMTSALLEWDKMSERETIINDLIIKAKLWQVNTIHNSNCRFIGDNKCSCGVRQLCNVIRELKRNDNEREWDFEGLDQSPRGLK